MDSNYISYLALITAVVSLIVSFVSLHRDRHVVTVRAVPIELEKGVLCLHVSVSNGGKRPISITHVLLRPEGKPGLYLNFAPEGFARVDVGEVRSCTVNPQGLPVTWTNAVELRKLKISVEDALGKKHDAKWVGQ